MEFVNTVKEKVSSLGDSGKGAVDKIVGIAVSMIVVAVTFPIALEELAAIDLSTEMSAVEPLLTLLLPVIAVISIILYITGQEL